MGDYEPYLVMLPGPTSVPHRVLQAMTKPMINHRGEEFRRLLKTVQERLSRVFLTRGQILVLTSSGTGGVQAAIESLVRSGDRVVVTVYGEFGARAAEFAASAGAHVVRAEVPLGDCPSPGMMEEACKAGAKALVVIANETSTGVKIPWMSDVASIAKASGAFLIVDAVSLLGGDELPVDALGIDICVTGSQKCLSAPPGLALVSVSERAQNYISKDTPRGSYFNLASYLGFSQKGETPYTPAIPLLYALDEALDIVLAEGLEERIRRHRGCAAALYAGFQAMGLKPVARQEIRSNTVLAFEYPKGVSDERFRALLAERHRVLVAGGFGHLRGRVFRVGCMGEVGPSHVNTTISSVSAVLASLGHVHDSSAARGAAQKILDREVYPLLQEG